MSDPHERYSRQMLLPGWGREGQLRLARRTAAVIGCGALGSHIASHLVRAGVGRVILADRDFVEWHNLPRQALYSEEDAAAGTPKAVAAARRLRQLNSAVAIEEHVVDVDAGTIESLLSRADVVFDGADNFELRYLVNEACVKLGIPWVYGGVLGTYGLSAAILPGQTPCLRCLLGPMPAPGTVPTCETAGVLGATVATVAALEVSEGFKILLGQRHSLLHSLVMVDLWTGDFERATVQKALDACPVCDDRQFQLLEAQQGSMTTVLCGRGAVQVTPRPAPTLDLDEIGHRLSKLGPVTVNEYLLRFSADGCEMTLFGDGRAIVKGAAGPVEARTFYVRYVGD
ncbi:MAG TPA: ThiF family adenylyltransferase [Anaerolineae bacterium]|nr:ThiF family adenylyltransferase [Anaerolineae bacterium]